MSSYADEMDMKLHDPCEDWDLSWSITTDEEIWDTDSDLEIEIQPSELSEKHHDESKSPWDETPKAIQELKQAFPNFRSETVLLLEQINLPKFVAFEIVSYITPKGICELMKMCLWESVSNSITDTGFVELLNYYLFDMDKFHIKRIDNRRNLLKACQESDHELLKIIMRKYQERENIALYFRISGGGNPMPARNLDEFNIETRVAMIECAKSGFLEGIKYLDRCNFGGKDTYEELVRHAMDSNHEHIVSYFLSGV